MKAIKTLIIKLVWAIVTKNVRLTIWTTTVVKSNKAASLILPIANSASWKPRVTHARKL